MALPSPFEIGTLIIALCALAATIWQAAIARKHNKLSVRPVLTLYRHDIDGFIHVRNNGSGPAIIRVYEIWKSGVLVEEDQLPNLIPYTFEAPELTIGCAIAVGEKIELVTCNTHVDNSHVAPLQALNFRIVYESIYGQRWTLE